jgi:hypothetical protein
MASFLGSYVWVNQINNIHILNYPCCLTCEVVFIECPFLLQVLMLKLIASSLFVHFKERGFLNSEPQVHAFPSPFPRNHKSEINLFDKVVQRIPVTIAFGHLDIFLLKSSKSLLGLVRLQKVQRDYRKRWSMTNTAQLVARRFRLSKKVCWTLSRRLNIADRRFAASPICRYSQNYK